MYNRMKLVMPKEFIIEKGMKQKPISIITVVFNAVNHIEKTIISVITQKYENMKYIIIDGGSTDGTVDIIQKYNDEIDYWVSEKDSGISDAFNKGIQEASGFILMLNAGDIFIDNKVLKEVAGELDHPIVAFEVISIAGRKVGQAHYKKQNLFTLSKVPHQGTFVHKWVYDILGLYSTGFKIRMDYEFFAKSVHGIKPKLIYKPIVLFDNQGISSSLKYKFRFEIEGTIIDYLYFDKNISYLMILPLYRTFKSFFGKILRKIGLRR